MLPKRTGTASATLTRMRSRPITRLKIGIIADADPNTAKQVANAPVARMSCALFPRFGETMKRAAYATLAALRVMAVIRSRQPDLSARDTEGSRIVMTFVISVACAW